MSEWSARADSVFHACQRDAGIAFPDMVKGYLCLHRCGLSDDQRAVELGRTGGKRETAVAPALRSCFSSMGCPSSVEDLTECLCQKCRMRRKRRRNVTRRTAAMTLTMWKVT